MRSLVVLTLGCLMLVPAAGEALARGRSTADESARTRKPDEEPDPLKVLAAHLSHGIGESPLDSPLVRDRLNAALLVAARRGASRADLLRLVPARQDLDERLAALEKARLIFRHGDGIRTTFPILVGRHSEQYYRLVSRTAARSYAKILPHVRALVKELRERGWSQWSYHFVWSQVFDSQFVWSGMIERGLAPPLAPVLVWVVYPPHPFKTGTNYYPDDELRDHLLAVSWTPVGANTTGRIGGSWRAVYSSALAGRPVDETAAEQLRRLGLLGAGDRVLVPVVKRDDPLYTRLQRTAHAHVEALKAAMHVRKLASLVGQDERYAWAMAYHDVTWEILARMVGRGEFQRPDTLSRGEAEGEAPALAGTCAVVEVYGPFLRLIERALQGSRSR
jgi:hypothetical protein